MQILTAPNIWIAEILVIWFHSHLLCLTMRSNSDYLGLTAIFNTDCLFKPRAGMILFYGRTCQITKTLFSLEFYADLYEGLTTKYYNLSWLPKMQFQPWTGLYWWKQKLWILTTMLWKCSLACVILIGHFDSFCQLLFKILLWLDEQVCYLISTKCIVYLNCYLHISLDNVVWYYEKLRFILINFVILHNCVFYII